METRLVEQDGKGNTIYENDLRFTKTKKNLGNRENQIIVQRIPKTSCLYFISIVQPKLIAL
jgi:hypothetical protein